MKLIGTLLGIALTTMVVSPAQAWFEHHQTNTTQFNSAFVTSDTQVGAFTGENTQISGVSINRIGADDISSMSRNVLTTGTAKATANSTVLVNGISGCDNCGQRLPSTRTTEANFAVVESNNIVQADTGRNIQQSGVSLEKAHVDDVRNWDNNRLSTGDAVATANTLTLVNVEWNHQMMPF